MGLVRVLMTEDFRRPIDGPHEPALHRAGSRYLLPAEIVESMARAGAVELDEGSDEDLAHLGAILQEVKEAKRAAEEEAEQRKRDAIEAREVELRLREGLPAEGRPLPEPPKFSELPPGLDIFTIRRPDIKDRSAAWALAEDRFRYHRDRGEPLAAVVVCWRDGWTQYPHDVTVQPARAGEPHPATGIVDYERTDIEDEEEALAFAAMRMKVFSSHRDDVRGVSVKWSGGSVLYPPDALDPRPSVDDEE